MSIDPSERGVESKILGSQGRRNSGFAEAVRGPQCPRD